MLPHTSKLFTIQYTVPVLCLRTLVPGTVQYSTTSTTFNAWDAEVLARMDDFESNEFPFFLTKKAAICRTLVNRLADDLLEGKGFSATSKFLKKAYATTDFPTSAKGQQMRFLVLFGSDPIHRDVFKYILVYIMRAKRARHFL